MRKNQFEQPEAERGESRKIVEVGAGKSPAPLFGLKKMKAGDKYVGIDIEKNIADTALIVKKARKADLDGIGPREGNVYFVRALGEKLPLADNSVDELILGNVLGEQFFGHISEEARRKFVLEAERVLKKGGRLVIKETYSSRDLPKIAGFLTGTSFRAEKFIGAEKSSDFAEMENEYASSDRVNTGEEESYYFILRKN